LATSLDYLRKPSDENLKRLISAAGNKLAYAHYSWSSSSSRMTIKRFWVSQLSKVFWSSKLERDVNAVKTYLLEQEESKWLGEVLRYLPENHVFNTTVYLNLGYDNIVFGEDVALNLNFHQFNVDKREAMYYLIHELAHAGYVRYHPLPKLEGIRTNKDLLSVVKYLTHLEGMGVMSALRLRISEDGLLDNDYKTLLNGFERARRINQYFDLLNKLKSDLNKKIDVSPTRVFEIMSGKETRLWYITGCHMAKEIEKHYGTETLGKLVKQGSEAFFKSFSEITDH
jgi:hypothetical protein